MPSCEFYGSDSKILDRDWGQEIVFADTPAYLGKLLVMQQGTKGGLQYHVEKMETFTLVSGIALVRYDNGDGKLTARVFRQGEVCHVPPGAVHQVEAITNCIIAEASTPHKDDRVRAEAKYGLTDDGGLPTTRIVVP